MEFVLLRYNNVPFKFDINDVNTITAEDGLIIIRMSDNTSVCGYCIK